jgi:hypothetical protein
MPLFRDILAHKIAACGVSMTALARRAKMDPALLSRAARGLKPFPAKHARPLGVSLGLQGVDLAEFVLEAHLSASSDEIRGYVTRLREQLASKRPTPRRR